VRLHCSSHRARTVSKIQDQGLVSAGIPLNNFMSRTGYQAEEIRRFSSLNLNVTFDVSNYGEGDDRESAAMSIEPTQTTTARSNGIFTKSWWPDVIIAVSSQIRGLAGMRRPLRTP